MALIIGSLDRGGSERQVVHLVETLQPRLADCHVVCLGQPGSQADAVRATGARVTGLELRKISPSGVVRLFRLLRRERPDVVYGFLFAGYGLGLPMAAVAAPRAGRVAGRRSLPDSDLPSERYPQGFGSLIRAIADICSDAVIANSSAVADRWCQNAPRLARKMHVIRNGVATAALPDQRPHERLVILCVANLIAYKGHLVLLDAVDRLIQGDAPPWELRLAGDGPLRAELEARIRDQGLTDHVGFLGSVADLWREYAEADIVVLPSFTEGLPNAVLEAMSAGVPVVASDVGGVREALGPHGGLVVPPRDPERLAEALLALLRDPELRHRLGSAGRARVCSEFSVERMARETLRVLEAAASRRGRRHSPGSAGTHRDPRAPWSIGNPPAADSPSHSSRRAGTDA